MSSEFEPLFESLKSTDVNDDFGIYTIRQTVTALTEEANLGMPSERQISLETSLQVAERSLVASADRDSETRRLLAVRDVARFLSVAAEGHLYGNTTEFSDLLPISHPESTAKHDLDYSELRALRASWIAADSRIDDSMRSVVASAYAADPTSAESTYFFTRLASADPALVPYDISNPITAALGMGSGANKGYWEVQLRNPNNGQWIEMGGGIIGYLTDGSGNLHSVVGHVVGIYPDGKHVDMAVTGHPILGSGIFKMPLSAIENDVQAVLPERALKGAKRHDIAPSSEKLGMAVPADQLLKSRTDMPSNWEVVDAPKVAGGPDVIYRLKDSGYTVEVYSSINADNKDSALNGGTEVPEGATEVGGGANGKFASNKPVYVLKRDASSYNGAGETEVVSRTQSWAAVFKTAKDDKDKYQKLVDGGKAPEAASTSTDVVSEIAATAKVDTKKMDSFLSDFINKYPEQKFSKNFQGDPEHATEEIIGRLAKEGANKDEIAVELSNIADNLPANEKFTSAKKGIMALVDAVVDYKPSGKKKSEKKIAEIPAPEAQAPATPEMDKIDNAKDMGILTKGQLEALPVGAQIAVFGHNQPGYKSYSSPNSMMHEGELLVKKEDGNFYHVNSWTKNYYLKYTPEQLADATQSKNQYSQLPDSETPVPKYDLRLNADPMVEKYPTEFGGYGNVSLDNYEEIKADAAAAKDAFNSYDGSDPQIQAMLKQRSQRMDSVKWHADKLKSAENAKIAYEAHEAVDWRSLEVGDEANSSFIENAPIGTQMHFTTTLYHEDDSVKAEDLHVTVEKIGDNQWKMEDDLGHFDYDKYTNKDVINETDAYQIDYIPPYLEPLDEPLATVNLDDLKQVGGQKGSNAGGIFEDADGNKFYVKFPESELHAQNEVLASRLYKKLGILGTDMQLGTRNGKPAVFSPIIPDAKGDLHKKLGDEAYMKDLQHGFAVDAWLANWDVAGLSLDNVMTNGDGKPVRVDPGGSLLFRAQGSPKGKAFGDKVTELDKFVDGSNAQSEEIFGKMTEEDKKASAENLLNITDAQIDDIVNMTITDPQQAEFLAETLKRRRKDILDHYGIEDTAATPTLSSDEPAQDSTDIVEVPADPKTPELTGYNFKQTSDGIWYPEEKLSPEDYYALRNGEKVPPHFPFLPRNTLSGDTLYFDKNGVKRWGQYGAAGAVLRRKKEDGSYEYLVVKRNAKASTDGGVWSIPGGAHDSKSDAANPSSTASRELKEELGWKLPVDATPSAEVKNQLSDDWAYDYSVYDVNNDLDPKMGGELTDAKWVSADELKQMQADGELHQSMDAATVDKVLAEADKADFNPTAMSDGKWWSKNDSTSFRKGKSSEIVKGDIVTVKGATGERDVVVTSDPVSEDGKVIFDFFNPENGKSGSYTWEADSNASIMSGHIDALKYTAKLEEAPKAETPSAPEAPKAEAPATEQPKALSGPNIQPFGNDVFNLTTTPGVNGQIDVNYYKNGELIGKISISDSLSDKEANDIVSDVMASLMGIDHNIFSGKPTGEASKGVTVHQKGYLKPASEKQLDLAKNMLQTADMSEAEKQELQNIIDKPDLVGGEIGSVIGKLKKVPSLTAEKDIPKKKDDIVDPASIESKQIQVGDKTITELAMDSTTGLSGHYFKDESGNDLGHVSPSQEVSGAWTATVKSENATTEKTYTDEESALASFGSSHVENGTLPENPFDGGTKDAKVSSFEDAEVPAEVNHDLTPKSATDVLDANLIMDQLLGEHPDHEVLPNGDVVIKSVEFTNKYGQKFKYDAVVRRTKKERFFAYVMETDLQTGERRAIRMGKEHHSYKALLGSMSKAKGVLAKSSPRDWFGKNKGKTESLPPVLGEEVDVTPQLSEWIDGVGSGADLANGIADYLADLGSSNQTFAKEIIEAKLEAKGLPKEFLSDVIQIMADNKAKAAAGLPEGMFEGIEGPVAPHMSYDGETPVKVGDYVDWTDPKTGKVYRGYVVQATYNHNSKDYKYSDQMLVILPEYNKEHGYNADHQRWRVSSNLKVVQKDAPMSEPFSPKAKEKATQEKISTGEAPEFTEPKIVPSEPVSLQEAPAEAPKASNIPDEIGNAKNDGAEGVPYFEIDGIQHPTYMEKDDINGAAVLGTSNPKTLEELVPGDLINISGQWWHVLTTGTDENGDFKVALSRPTDGWPASKVIKIDETKKPLLNTKFASITPEKPIVPTAPEKVAEADDSMPYNQVQYDMWLGITGKGEFADEKLNELVNDINGKILLGEDVTQKDMADALGQILNAPLKKDPEPITDWEKELLEQTADSLGTSSEGQAVQDVIDASVNQLEEIKEAPKPTEPEATGYNHGIKQLTPEHFDESKVKDFKMFKTYNLAKSAEVGDIVRSGKGWKKKYYQILEKQGRGQYKIAKYDSSGKFIGVQEKVWLGYYGHVLYKPTPTFSKKNPDYFAKSELASPAGPVEVKVVDGIKTFGSVDAVKAAGVDKKSDAGNAAFGLSNDLGDGVTPSMIGVSQIELWKHGFNDQKVKTKNDKYVITGGIVSNGDSAGVVTKTNKDNGVISVTWLSGPDAGKSMDNVPANSVDDTGNWMSPQAAGDYGVKVDTAQIEAGKAKIAEKVSALKAQHAKKIEQEKKLAAIAAKKKASTVKGAGAELETPAEVLPWNKSAFEGAPSLEEALKYVDSKTGLAASFGQQVAVDSTQVEDNKLTVSKVEKNGKPVTKLNFTLTAWTADGQDGVIAGLQKNPEAKKHKGIKITELQNQDGGLMKTAGDVNSYYVGGGNGYTYEVPLKDADGKQIGTVRVLRAQDGLETPEFAGKSTHGGNGPLAFHNRVEVVFDDIATPEQIQKALESVGVTEARPATPADTRIAMENRLITLFGDVPNGTENLTGELRKEILDDVKAQYGVDVNDLHITNKNGVINFELPKEIADKLAKDMNFEDTLRHGFEPPSWASQDYGKYFYDELVLGNGSGGVRSAADRAMHGIYSVPGSGNADINNTGGSYVFTGKNSTSNVGSGRPVQIHTKGSKLLSRLGLYGNTGDSWGALKSGQLGTLGKNSLSEVMVKGAIAWGDVDFIALSPSIYSKVISYFQSQGVTEVNGIPLLNFFKKK